MEIFGPWIGEMLSLSLLLVLNGRIFWTSRTRMDALSLLGPFSLFAAILGALAWGVRFSGAAIFVLALICSITNYRSLVRFSQKLFVDSYSVKFFVASILLLAVTIFFIAAEIYLRPVSLDGRRYNVAASREYFSAPLSADGFALKKAQEIGDRRNMTLYTFFNKDKAAQKDAVVLFVPDVLAESLSYEPYFVLLARRGWTVLAADVYSPTIKSAEDLKGQRPFRRASLVFSAYSSGGTEAVRKQKFPEPRAKKFHEIYEASYRALAQVAAERYPGKKIFVASDSSAFFPPPKLRTIFKGASFFNLKNVPEYKTPGWGFAAQTNPIFSRLFLGRPRDKTSFEPSWCATQTMIALERFLKDETMEETR